MAKGSDFYGAVEDVCTLSAPTVFDGMSIVTAHIDGQMGSSVSRGTTNEAAAYSASIVCGDIVRGSISIWMQRTCDDIDRLIIDDLAMRLEAALNAADRTARQRHVADTLQRALLPMTLPQKGTLAISAAYRPATDETAVGGDWYDVFELPDGRTAFSVGDVAGHGLQAAVIMGEVRQAFRAAAVHAKSPSLVLERANTIVNMRADAAIVTALFGVFDPKTSAVTYAVAGHPPPIIAPVNGYPQLLPATGIPLGVASGVQTCDWTITLAPGTLFALFTDGLIEHSRDIIAGEVELLAAAGAEVRNHSRTSAQNIIDTIFKDRDNVDDSAMLVFRAEHAQREEFDFTFSAIALAVPLLRHALEKYAESLDMTPEVEFALLMTVGEAAANAVEHASIEQRTVGLVRVHVQQIDDNVLIEVRNDGGWKAAEHRDERGRGIPIMRTLSEHLEIKTTQTETLVRITLRA